MKILFTFILLSVIGCANSPKKAQNTPQEASVAVLADTMTVVFSGDYMQHTPQISASRVDSGYDYHTHLRHIAPLWQAADYSIINLETTLSRTGPYTGYPMFRSPCAIAGALRTAGITHAALANNHAMDRGYAGVLHTLEILREAGLESFGVWLTSDTIPRSFAMLSKGALRIAVLNHTYGTNGMPCPAGVEINTDLDTTAILRDIAQARLSSATHIIAMVHWGDEYITTPNREQIELAHWLRAQGVNAVIGSHPHTAQPIDHQNSIVYSLGNFVSNQRKVNTDAGLSVTLTITKSDTISIVHTPHYVDISAAGPNKYRVLPLSDTLVIRNPTARADMIRAIKRVERIISTPVAQ